MNYTEIVVRISETEPTLLFADPSIRETCLMNIRQGSFYDY